MKLAHRIRASDAEVSRDGLLSLASKIGYMALLYKMFSYAEPRRETIREWAARKLPPGMWHGDAEPQKSKNHIAFIGNEEYFTGENGDLFRAPINAPMERGYRSGARFEATKAALPLWMKLYGPKK